MSLKTRHSRHRNQNSHNHDLQQQSQLHNSNQITPLSQQRQSQHSQIHSLSQEPSSPDNSQNDPSQSSHAQQSQPSLVTQQQDEIDKYHPLFRSNNSPQNQHISIQNIKLEHQVAPNNLLIKNDEDVQQFKYNDNDEELIKYKYNDEEYQHFPQQQRQQRVKTSKISKQGKQQSQQVKQQSQQQQQQHQQQHLKQELQKQHQPQSNPKHDDNNDKSQQLEPTMTPTITTATTKTTTTTPTTHLKAFCKSNQLSNELVEYTIVTLFCHILSALILDFIYNTCLTQNIIQMKDIKSIDQLITIISKKDPNYELYYYFYSTYRPKDFFSPPASTNDDSISTSPSTSSSTTSNTTQQTSNPVFQLHSQIISTSAQHLYPLYQFYQKNPNSALIFQQQFSFFHYYHLSTIILTTPHYYAPLTIYLAQLALTWLEGFDYNIISFFQSLFPPDPSPRTKPTLNHTANQFLPHLLTIKLPTLPQIDSSTNIFALLQQHPNKSTINLSSSSTSISTAQPQSLPLIINSSLRLSTLDYKDSTQQKYELFYQNHPLAMGFESASFIPDPLQHFIPLINLIKSTKSSSITTTTTTPTITINNTNAVLQSTKAVDALETLISRILKSGDLFFSIAKIRANANYFSSSVTSDGFLSYFSPNEPTNVNTNLQQQDDDDDDDDDAEDEEEKEEEEEEEEQQQPVVIKSFPFLCTTFTNSKLKATNKSSRISYNTLIDDITTNTSAVKKKSPLKSNFDSSHLLTSQQLSGIESLLTMPEKHSSNMSRVSCQSKKNHDDLIKQCPHSPVGCAIPANNDPHIIPLTLLLLPHLFPHISPHIHFYLIIKIFFNSFTKCYNLAGSRTSKLNSRSKSFITISNSLLLTNQSNQPQSSSQPTSTSTLSTGTQLAINNSFLSLLNQFSTTPITLQSKPSTRTRTKTTNTTSSHSCTPQLIFQLLTPILTTDKLNIMESNFKLVLSSIHHLHLNLLQSAPLSKS